MGRLARAARVAEYLALALDSIARAVARATLLGYFGYFVGPPTLGFIAGAFGLRFAFVFAAVFGVPAYV